MQKSKDISVIFRSSGCAGAHPHATLDPPLRVRHSPFLVSEPPLRVDLDSRAPSEGWFRFQIPL